MKQQGGFEGCVGKW